MTTSSRFLTLVSGSFAAVACSSAARAQAENAFGPPVAVRLESPQAGRAVNPHAIVTWRLRATVPVSGSMGLAALVADIVQQPPPTTPSVPANPSFFDLSPSAAVPVALTNFARPYGVSNPDTLLPGGGTAPGFGGTALPDPEIGGFRNLRQVGGAQNNFGVSGTLFGTSATLVTGVGQSAAGVVIAEGVFSAPVTVGEYRLFLDNVLVTVLLDVAPAGTPSPCQWCVPVVAEPLRWIVACIADFNGDGTISLQDLFDFLAAYFAGDPTADLNRDGSIGVQDIFDYLAAYFAGCS